MDLTIETITPSMAEEWLEHNHVNRPLRRSRCELYARAMSLGEWKLTGEAIMWNGTDLLNGQHRLRACVIAGVPFETVVARNVDASAMTVLDSGLGRTMGDVLQFSGVTNAFAVAGAAKLLLEWRNGFPAWNDPLTRDDIAAFAVSNADSLNDAVLVGKRVSRAIGLPPSVWAAFAFEIAAVDVATAAEFTERLIDGVRLSAESPILALRSWSMNSVTVRRTRRKAEILLAASKAWNAHVEGRPLKIVKVGSGEEMPRLAVPQ